MPTNAPDISTLPGYNGGLELVTAENVRRMAYDIPEQLNCLADDVQAGLFGEAAKTGKFAQYIADLKAQYPKTYE